MESNRSLVFFIIGLYLLPKIDSDDYPSLFVVKISDQYTYYNLADKFEYSGGEQKVIKFSTSPEYPLYNACPEENTPLDEIYALQIQRPVTDFEPIPLERFIKGSFHEYNCPSPIKPTVLKFREGSTGRFAPEDQRYDIGFVIHEESVNFPRFETLYENLTETNEYGFIKFLTITMDKQSETAISARHQIINGKLLEPDAAPNPTQNNEKNVNVYGFDVNSLYEMDNQLNMFSSISSISHITNPNESLIKVQLAPQEDFLLDTWKLPTLMDLNTTAMWNQLHSQWKKVETFVRKVARELDRLDVETGTAKILTLSQPLYLREEKQSPVYQYIWKLIQFKQFYFGLYTQAILIVMHNDPFTPDQEPICNDVSEEFGWMVSNEDYKTGLTYACLVSEDITSQLYDHFELNYEVFNLKDFQRLDQDENGNVIWVNENIASKIAN